MESFDDFVFRDLMEKDLKTLLKLRNSEENLVYFLSSRILPEEEHEKWFFDRLRDLPKFQLVADLGGKLIAIVYLTPISSNICSVSINVETSFQSKKLGSKLLSLIIERARALNLHKLQAEVHKDNLKSTLLFGRFGFVQDTTSNGPFVKYTLSLQ
jgi:L-amino acid N-acyltransferase YncA